MAIRYVNPGNPNVAVWEANTQYSVMGVAVHATDLDGVANGYIFECLTPICSSGSTEPVWNTAIPGTSTTTDGTCTWLCQNPDTWNRALPGLQGAIDRIVAAGDIVYCRGTEIRTTSVKFDVVDGTNVLPQKIIGCNASGNVDGTRYTINFGNNDCHGFEAIGAGIEGFYIANIKLTSSLTTGIYYGIRRTAGYFRYGIFENIWIDGGFYSGLMNSSYIAYASFSRCKFSNMRSHGVYPTGGYISFFFCTFSNNGGHGANNGMVYYDCLAYGNVGSGFYLYSSHLCINCIADNNDCDGSNDAGFSTINSLYGLINCRSTNNGKYGFRTSASLSLTAMVGCFADHNTSGDVPAIGKHIELNPDGAGGWNDFATTDVNQGYIDPTNLDFNLDPDEATLFSKALELQ